MKAIRYVGTDAYIKEYLGYTADYQPTSVAYTIPSAATGVNGVYTYVYTYHQDNAVATTRLPALGDPGLGIETLTHGYNSFGKLTTLATSLGATLVTAPGTGIPGTEYTSFGELAVIHLRNNGGPLADITRVYDTDTRRLAQLWTTRATGPTTIADVRYAYDPAGNVARVADLTAGDTQCFGVDHLRRLTSAWTPGGGDCGAVPTVGALGGPAAYWHTYSYDAIGNRTHLVERTATDTRDTSYTVPTGAHRLTGTSTVDATGTIARSFSYDDSGNMLTRPGTAGAQTMTWDAEGHLATSQDAAGTTSYVYDVDGNRLVRFDPAGATLYLPGQELRFTTATGAKKVTRYYTHASQVIAMRTATGITWLSGDHHDTPQIAVAAVGQAISIRRELPFGGLRGTTGTWPAAMDKGFVGGTNDNTGLTHLGAREYDPLIGRFISVDPVIDTADPQQLHGYAYANNAPITASDADGRWPSWKSIAKAATKVVTAPGKFIYDHAGQISVITGVAAIACAFAPPPLDAAAPFLEIASVATGAIQTAKDCSGGSKVDCALGVASLVPGVRAGIKGVKAAQAVKEADATLDGLRAIPKGDPWWRWARREMPMANAERDRAAAEMLEYEEEWNPFLAATMPASWRAQFQGWKAFKNGVLGAFVFRELQHQYNEYQERREVQESRDDHREGSRGATAAPVPAPTPVRVPGSRIYAI